MWTGALFALTLGLTSAPQQPESPPPLRWAIVEHEITPREPLPLGGFTERQDRLMEGVAMPQMMRVLRLEQGNQQVLIASLDFLTIPESFVMAVREELASEAKVILAATHTHSAPDSQMLNDRMTMRIPGIAGYRQRVTADYVARVVEGLEIALAAETSTAENLTLLEFSTNLVRSRRADTPVDQAGRLLRAGDVTLWGQASAHATILDSGSNELHGDWPGVLSVQLHAPVFVGAMGNASPHIEADTAVEKVASFVEKWLGSARDPLQTIKEIEFSSPSLRVSSVRISLPDPTPSAEFERQFGAPGPLAELLVQRFAPPFAEITVIGVGELAMVAVSAELTAPAGSLIVEAVKEASYTNVVLFTMANGWMGYVMDEQDFAAGGYEVALSFYGPTIIRELVRAAEQAARGTNLD